VLPCQPQPSVQVIQRTFACVADTVAMILSPEPCGEHSTTSEVQVEVCVFGAMTDRLMDTSSAFLFKVRSIIRNPSSDRQPQMHLCVTNKNHCACPCAHVSEGWRKKTLLQVPDRVAFSSSVLQPHRSIATHWTAAPWRLQPRAFSSAERHTRCTTAKCAYSWPFGPIAAPLIRLCLGRSLKK
jgi:hypothetical protein